MNYKVIIYHGSCPAELYEVTTITEARETGQISANETGNNVTILDQRNDAIEVLRPK